MGGEAYTWVRQRKGWGVRGPSGQTGKEVLVKKFSGGWSRVTLGAEVWIGDFGQSVYEPATRKRRP